MDTRKQIILCLAWFICLKPDDTESTQYCENTLRKSPAINVCQSSAASGREIFIDSTGAPNQETAVCKCVLTYSTEFLRVHYSSTTIYNESDVTFKINEQFISTSTTSEQSFNSSPIHIIFNKSVTDYTPVCFGIKADSSSSSGNITITCYSLGHSFSTTIATTQEQLLTESSLSVNPDTTTNAAITNMQTFSEADKRHGEFADVKKDTNIGVIVGAAVGGGGFLSILAMVTIVVCKRKRTRMQLEQEATIQHQGDTYTDLTVSSRGNTYDQIDGHSDIGAYTDLTRSSRGNEYDQIDVHVEDNGPVQYMNTNSANSHYENPDFVPTNVIGEESTTPS